jgi:RimJ/RimL family protein N-acetyltransferase
MMLRELLTTRLRLRPCTTDDTGLVHDLWTNEHVRRFLFDERVISADEARSFVEASLASFERQGYGLWLVFALDGDRLVGFAGLLRTDGDAPNLIYGIHPVHGGQGYATEAASAVLDYALGGLALPLVKADVDEPNVSSTRVLEKLGMRRTGRALSAGRPLLYYETRPPSARADDSPGPAAG